MALNELSQHELAKAASLAHRPQCEDYDKMISGMLYDSFVPELKHSRYNARVACHKFNNHIPGDADASFDGLQKARSDILAGVLGHVGDDVLVETPFHVDYGCNVRVGARFYANFNLTILDSALVHIGDRVMLGPNVTISTATHEVEVASRVDNIEYARPITIGDDCWIGGQVVILPGVIIGQGCTIGAGAIVTRNIPAWSVAVGAPAKVVKKVTPMNPSLA
ncbi:maltose acetyltransferase domain-containing protein [Hirsutella rhossiliensis]|uniref:Maltose acetyltransferase domain-containing protein n=1 Tax=Hirsutella rhossiliensis TaxID=111463 RepID=A0A9P8N7Q7_9HYPO|nr:maltose acetyltransferase domain-containing protein [Hirsutella rhossiliensis]KAH0968520.1 maltose acetyltransferase domain-containing protein [Hirsutella rhossiliensis]